MIGRGVFLLTVLSTCVLSLPVTSGQLENEDVKVMKCIVEALADVLSRPHLVPISQECLVTLKTDDRLLTILRHHNFLKELQEIAVQGGHERAVVQRYADAPTPTTKALHTKDRVADRSMLDALGGPGERSILSQRKSTGDGREEEDESREGGQSREDGGAKEVEAKRRKEAKEGGHDKKRANSEEISEEEDEAKDIRGDGSDGKGVPSRNKPTTGRLDVEDKVEGGKISVPLSRKHNSNEEEEEEARMRRGDRENVKRWTKRAKHLQPKKKTVHKEEPQFSSQQEVPHHSKEVTGEEEEEEEEEEKKRFAQRSPEEKELQMIARGGPEDKRVMEDEGSGIRKEEPEIESLAAIESELENVAQKLHDLRRG